MLSVKRQLAVLLLSIQELLLCSSTKSPLL
jgi:hypothetical protein